MSGGERMAARKTKGKEGERLRERERNKSRISALAHASRKAGSSTDFERETNCSGDN